MTTPPENTSRGANSIYINIWTEFTNQVGIGISNYR